MVFSKLIENNLLLVIDHISEAIIFKMCCIDSFHCSKFDQNITFSCDS